LIRARSKRCLIKRKHSSQQSQAQLGKTEMDVKRRYAVGQRTRDRTEPVGQRRSAKQAAQAAVKAAEALVEQARLNLEFTDVKSLVDGIAGIAQIQIGNLVNPTTVLTTVFRWIRSRRISRLANKSTSTTRTELTLRRKRKFLPEGHCLI